MIDRHKPNLESPLKIWPFLVFAAYIANHGGAVRVWFLARALDKVGQGWVTAGALRQYTYGLGMKRRTYYRWVDEALGLGLMRKSKRRFYLVGLGKTAKLLWCRNLGRPAEINGEQFVRKGWRPHVWAGHLVTLHGRPISQRTKKRLTGISERTQRSYQSKVRGASRRNFVKRGMGTHLHAEGFRKVFGYTIFEWRGQLIQRLPDIRIVPTNVARACRYGRSRKAQKLINSFFLERDQFGQATRLFHSSNKAAKSTIRKFTKSDLPPWEMPETFILQKVERNFNIWEVSS